MDYKNQKWFKNVPSELEYSLDNLFEDGEKITLQLAVKEAEYILTLFSDGGHSLSEALESDNKEERKEAQKELRKIKRFIKKYKG